MRHHWTDFGPQQKVIINSKGKPKVQSVDKVLVFFKTKRRFSGLFDQAHIANANYVRFPALEMKLCDSCPTQWSYLYGRHCSANFRYIPCWGEYDDCSRIMRRWGGGSLVHTGVMSGGWVIWILDINITFLQSLPVPCVWERGPRVIRDDISSSDPGGWRSLSFSIIPTSDRD